MSFDIGRDQQKIFIDNFMRQVLDLSLRLVDEGKDRPSPGETIHVVGSAVIRELNRMHALSEVDESDDDTGA